MKIEIGLTSFADNGDIYTEQGKQDAISNAQRIRNIIEEIETADRNGLDVYGLGEHHRPDYAVSDPVTVLAAAARNTKHIKLTSAVTVLSSDDPVRVYERFSTLDAVSNGRAEIMVGRGSFIESFPLFGYNLDDYEQLFNEKIDLLMKINQHEIVNWKGHLRPSIDNLGVYPRAEHNALPISIATGGTPESSLKAGALGLPITYAIIGGDPKRFRRNIDMYQSIAESYGHKVDDLKIATHSWGYIADTDEQAKREFFPSVKASHDILAQERGWPPYDQNSFERETGPHGALYVGSPETVAQKIIETVETLGITRFMLHTPVGSMPHERTIRTIELLANRVKPFVNKYFENK
ncbi:LLM class flavin-dependent oxidoreductase [Staphylococcus gallinarum]|uniref:LLM class flavin-dependent oxidoreductase n=1 Tax=Staphylococcus gallinarum TaxID=1293 RepID=UPI000D1E55BF|nr:LLM class flavin-dependent oxidoreductase [Staphylococcus gallinarum]MCD8821524.1 LLM class flavin-dependent oxidoreductase [Staphylococcus gallinarum]MCQ9289359.1 LLM class flavin-dependent oxidoreductase [Staphylococcus gallinarum]PTL05709.1 LLM class flavin-dependent oxidoreductase [Staphylococcus gallinarum]PTL11872.1 LLM class flavin-dependent oxidoreductase [Staphylococcus gallinarum]RIL27333.1 LLM class flavin-dependent oxidoreductase [Staphylococcus gallinarum]